MTLNELAQDVFKGKDIREQFIGIYEGPNKKIYPDYADEILETHGDLTVKDHLVTENGILIVALTEK